MTLQLFLHCLFLSDISTKTIFLNKNIYFKIIVIFIILSSCSSYRLIQLVNCYIKRIKCYKYVLYIFVCSYINTYTLRTAKIYQISLILFYLLLYILIIFTFIIFFFRSYIFKIYSFINVFLLLFV